MAYDDRGQIDPRFALIVAFALVVSTILVTYGLDIMQALLTP